MKKCLIIFVAVLLLCGCGAQQTFETVDDDYVISASATVRSIKLELPKEAAKPTMESASGGSLYLCDGYTLAVQTFAGGDLDRTVRQITGYSIDRLQPIRTKAPDAVRYDLAWTAAAESGDQVARAVILDDGVNHYTVSVMADAEKASDHQSTWKALLGSVTLSTD